MSRETFVMRNGVLVNKAEAAPLDAGPFIVRDAMDATWHPADGKHYDSKSAFRRATKDAGCVEVGTEPLAPRLHGPPKMDRRQRADDIKRSVYELRNAR